MKWLNDYFTVKNPPSAFLHHSGDADITAFPSYNFIWGTRMEEMFSIVSRH